VGRFCNPVHKRCNYTQGTLSRVFLLNIPFLIRYPTPRKRKTQDAMIMYRTSLFTPPVNIEKTISGRRIAFINKNAT
jgi:hypothetical protein